TPDGHKLVWACNKIHVVDVQAHKELRHFPDGRLFASTDYNSLAIAPDGKLLAAGFLDTNAYIATKQSKCEVQVRELESSNVVETIPTRSNAYQVAFVNSGSGLVIREETIRFWDRKARKELYQLTGSCFAVSPDEKLLVVGSADGVIRAYDLASGKEL